jgi:hypothetical protein
MLVDFASYCRWIGFAAVDMPAFWSPMHLLLHCSRVSLSLLQSHLIGHMPESLHPMTRLVCDFLRHKLFDCRHTG